MAPQNIHGSVRNENLFFQFQLPESSQTIIFALSWLDIPPLQTTHATIVYENPAQLTGETHVNGVIRDDKTYSFTLDNGALITGHLAGDAEIPAKEFRGFWGRWLTPYKA
jgi:hypothetical protein